MVEKYHNFIGGKRLRGALTRESYQMFGGEEEYNILKASMVVELIHGFGLIHDDIMDNDDLRRGKPTIHEQYLREILENKDSTKEEAYLYGISMAMMIGDLGPLFSNLIIAETNFPPERKVKLLSKLSETVLYTIYGQGMDVTFEQNEIPTEEEAMQVHRYKTAYYTITGPLQYGALLAGIEETDPRYQALEKYGLPIGIAFQLKDDELGIFSESEKIGKPVFSDLRQGKVTVLFAKAFENADNGKLKFLKKVHGHPEASSEDLEKVKEIIVETGALEYSRNLSLQLIDEGTSYIKEVTSDEKYRDLLNLIAEFVSSRDK
jgi:geranylgeranyl diphosphate synthase type I